MNVRLRAKKSILDPPGYLRLSSSPLDNDDTSTGDKTPTTDAARTPTNLRRVSQLSTNSTGERSLGVTNGGFKKTTRPSPRSKRRTSPDPDAIEEFGDGKDEDELTPNEDDSDFEDDEAIILEALKTQDYDALTDYMNDDDIDPNEVTSEGRRYLHDSVAYNDEKACEIILDAGGLINSRDNYGWTALHYAAAFDLTEMTRYLLDKGADPRKKDGEGLLAEEHTQDPDLVQMLTIARARRGLRSISSVSETDLDLAQEEVARRNERRQGPASSIN